jgi:predicted nucleotidyltransferase
VFGSLLRPDYRPGQSDIDLLVEFQALTPWLFWWESTE